MFAAVAAVAETVFGGGKKLKYYKVSSTGSCRTACPFGEIVFPLHAKKRRQ